MSLIKKDSKTDDAKPLTIRPTNALQPASNVIVTIPRPKIKQKVLDEDSYIESIEKIIQRDFFPDLQKLRTQSEWLEAEEKGNLEKMRELQMRLKGQNTNQKIVPDTPASWTPREPETPSQIENQENQSKLSTNSDQFSIDGTNMSLTRYQLLNTSEDNSAFDAILEKNNLIQKSKYAWMTESDKQKETQLLLTSGEKPDKAGLLTWDYKPKNLLMFNPDGAPMTEKEIKIANVGPPKEIVYENTRIIAPKMAVIEKKKDSTRIDLDEIRGLKPLDVSSSPQVGGYSMVLDPSPAPGVDQSPFTTWGSVEGTPLLIETETSSFGFSSNSNGPSFKIPETPRREQIALELDRKVKKTKKMATEKKDIRFTPTRISTPMSPRSPFLQKDNQLRASYQSPMLNKSNTPKRTGAPTTPNVLITPKVITPSRTPTKPTKL